MDQNTPQETATDDEECCRICLTVKNDLNSDSNRHLNSSKFFQDIFLNFTGIDVMETKNISSWICDDCEDKIMDFHRFRQQCCESNKTLLEKAGTDISIKEVPEPELECAAPLERLEMIDESIKKEEVSSKKFEYLNQLITTKMLNNAEVGNEDRKKAASQIPVDSVPNFAGFEIMYECSYCFKTYRKHLHSSFIHHLKIHQPKQNATLSKNECKICLKVLKTERSMQAHFVSSHITYNCEGCHKHFRSNEVPNHKCLTILKNLVKTANLNKTTVVPKNEAPLSCRTCLATSGDNFVDIVHSTFHDAFQCCTGIDVKSNPGITTSVCDVCEAKLIDFYNFQKKCWESDLVLRKKFKI